MPTYEIGEEFEQFVQKQVEAGRYASADDVVSVALRLLEERDANSGTAQPASSRLMPGDTRAAVRSLAEDLA